MLWHVNVTFDNFQFSRRWKDLRKSTNFANLDIFLYFNRKLVSMEFNKRKFNLQRFCTAVIQLYRLIHKYVLILDLILHIEMRKKCHWKTM